MEVVILVVTVAFWGTLWVLGSKKWLSSNPSSSPVNPPQSSANSTCCLAKPQHLRPYDHEFCEGKIMQKKLENFCKQLEFPHYLFTIQYSIIVQSNPSADITTKNTHVAPRKKKRSLFERRFLPLPAETQLLQQKVSKKKHIVSKETRQKTRENHPQFSPNDFTQGAFASIARMHLTQKS